MREVGIDISGQRPKATDEFLGQRVNYVITLCDRQKERNCPIFPGVVWRHDMAARRPTGRWNRRRREKPPCARYAMKYSAAWSNLSVKTLEGLKGTNAMEVKEIVKEKYGEAARRVTTGGG